MRSLFLLVFFGFVLTSNSEIISTNLDGGPVTTSTGIGGKVNAKSSLHRAWIVINDPGCPIQISGTGIQTRYEAGNFNFVAAGSFNPSADTAAFEIRYVLYDLFGNHMITLSDTEVADWKSGKTTALNGLWPASHDDVMGLLTVVTFVGRARSQDGKIWRCDPDAIKQRLAEINLQNDSVLNPSPAAKQ